MVPENGQFLLPGGSVWSLIKEKEGKEVEEG